MNQLNSPVLNRELANGMLGHLLALIALNRAKGGTTEELALWQIKMLQQHGYYAELKIDSKYNLESFLSDFVRGRRLIYDDLKITTHDGETSVRTKIWFYEELPEAFFYFDVSMEEFSRFASALARAHAAASGVELRLEHRDGFEIAVFREKKLSEWNGDIC